LYVEQKLFVMNENKEYQKHSCTYSNNNFFPKNTRVIRVYTVHTDLLHVVV